MTQARTQFRRSFETYHSLIASVVMFLMLIFFVLSVFYDVYIEHSPVSDQFFKKWLVMLILASIILFIGITLGIKRLWKLAKSSDTIMLAADHISIGKDTVLFHEIKEINTIDLAYISIDQYWGASLLLKNGETIFIPGDRSYAREQELFKALEAIHQANVSELKQEEIPFILDKEENGAKEGHAGYYGFNLFTSVDHLLMSALIGMGIAGLFKYINSPIAFFFLGILILFYFLMMDFSYYFEIDGSRFTIKNKMRFGYSREYDLKEIKKAIIYTRGSGRNARQGILIFTNDYHSKFFSCNSFRSEKWNKMADTLRKNGIQVINRFEEKR